MTKLLHAQATMADAARVIPAALVPTVATTVR